MLSKRLILGVLVCIAVGGCSYDAGDLSDAIERRDIERIQRMLSTDPTLAKGGSRESPIHSAIVLGYDEIVKVLVDAGADVNAQFGTERETPLYWASREGRLSTVRLLIENGADVNKVSKGGKTPLHVAALRGDLSLVEFLLQSGADPQAMDSAGKTPDKWAYQESFMSPIGRVEGHSYPEVAELIRSFTREHPKE